jgi:flagellar biosynthesis/type III secretory pathway chaperone
MKRQAPMTEQGHEVIPSSSLQDNSAPPGMWGAMAMECNSMAEELLHVLQRETACLRGFQSKELLQILPRKELLTRELESGLKSLQLRRGELGEEGDTPHLAALRRTLAEVHRANRFNQVFIKGSLDYWQGLMAVFSPQTYGLGSGSSPASPPGPAPRGFTFSKEV